MENFLGDIAGIEFECSIPAAELNSRLNNKFNKNLSESWKYENIDLATPDGSGGVKNGTYTVQETNWTVSDELGTHGVVFARLRTNQQATSTLADTNKTTRKLFGPYNRDRSITGSPTQHVIKDPVENPLLLGVKYGKIFLPIASFVTMELEDSCNYVQVGSEVRGDTLHATRLDDVPNRLAIIESMSELNITSDSHRDSLPDVVKSLIDDEISTQEQSLRLLFTQSFVNHMFSGNKFNDDDTLKVTSTAFADSPEKSMVDEYKIRPIGPAFLVNENTLTQLAAAKNMTTRLLSLGLLLRHGGIYQPLVSVLSPELITANHIPDLTLLQIRQLNQLATIGTSNHPEKVGTSQIDIRVYDDESLDARWLGTLQKFGALTLGSVNVRLTRNGYTVNDSIKSFTPLQYFSASNVGARNRVKFTSEKYKDQVGLNKRILKVMSSTRQSNYDFAMSLGLTHALKDIQALDLPQETIIEQVIRIQQSGGEATGVIKDMKIGKAVGSMLFQARVTQDRGAYSIEILGRPNAMPNERLRTLFSHTLSATSSTELSNDKASDITNVLTKLKAKDELK